MPETPKPSLAARVKDRFVPSKGELLERLTKAVHWADAKIPTGVRTLLGVPLMIGGVFSFLPVLGLWMLPVGAALVALDFPRPRRRLLHWLKLQKRRLARKAKQEEEARPPDDAV